VSDFEKEYYESDRFWEGDAIQDQNNINRIQETAGMIPSDAVSLVDIGCGNGVFVNYLQKEKPGLKLMAVDRSTTALKFVRTDKMEGDIADIHLDDRSFDCVSCLEVIEHLPIGIFKKALSELTRISKKYVIISVPYAEDLEKNHTQCPSCKSIFNADLHLRNFSDERMKHLLEENGFEMIGVKKAGEQRFYKGHARFAKSFYPNHFRTWNSPICPICGYKSGTPETVAQTETVPANRSAPARRSLVSYFTVIPKLFWPKETKYYWIIALYKRK
jgi:SAM-dependent methyltransferase